jgi:O-glycosyl hydrolase
VHDANLLPQLNFIPLPRDDQYQVWLSKEALARGVNYIYADAWSADFYMKTNNSETYGGYLCGVWNTSCESGDWRQSYADKIVKYIQDYEDEGVHIDYVGFLNEPDIATPYASMQSNGRQAADFIKVLHPTIQEAGLTTEIACCDATGWENQRDLLQGIQRWHQGKNLGLVTSHGYSGAPDGPFKTQHHVWQTEWSTFDELNYNWYTAGGSESDGITWANNILNSFTLGGVNGFLYWWGSAEKNDNEMLILVNGTSTVRVTKRLWAHAHYGKKFIRKGAYRVDATSDSDSLNVSAFTNTDGTTAVQVINNSNSTETVTLEVPLGGHAVQTYLTNQKYDLEQGVAKVHRQDGTAVAKVPGQSMLSFYICA